MVTQALWTQWPDSLLQLTGSSSPMSSDRLLWVPLVITVWVLNLIVGTMDKSLALLPAPLRGLLASRRTPGTISATEGRNTL